MSTQETYAEKIAALLRKAESTTFPEEAEALTAKAEELMLRYAIDEQMLARAGGKRMDDKIVRETIIYTGSYARAHYDIGANVARVNGCRVMISTSGKTVTLHLIGFKSDIDRVRMLDASLQIQCQRALLAWYKGHKATLSYAPTGMERFKMMREFIFGFANGAGLKLAEARQAAETSATQAHGPGVGLVLVDRRTQVDDFYRAIPKGRARALRLASGGYAARNAGVIAGRNSDTGATRVGGTRGAIR